MTHRPWSREGPAISAPAAAGVAYTAAWLVALLIWPSNLSVAASGAQVLAAYTGHRGVAIAQYLLAQGIAAAALAAVVIALGRAAGGPDTGAGRLGRVAIVAGVTAAMLSLVELALGLLLAGWAVPDGETGRAHLLFEAINRLDGVKMLALAATAAAGAGLALVGRPDRSRVLPRWLGSTAALLASALVASGVGYLLLHATMAAAAYASLPLLLIWVTGAGIALGRANRGDAAQSEIDRGETVSGDAAPTAFTPALKRLSVVVILGAVMTILDTTIVNVAINTLGRDLQVSVATIQWVATGYLLALSLVIPLTGWAVERFGARKLWFGALTLFIAGSALSGAAWSASSLIAFRIVQGFAGGVILPVGQTILAREAGAERMGRVMSVIAVPAMLGPVLGPVIGGAIIGGLSWRWIFYVNLPVGVLALGAAWRWLRREEPQSPDAPIDRVGIALLSPGLAAFVYGVSEAGTAGIGSTRTVVGTVAGLALIGAFVWHALRSRHPLIDVRMFADRTFSSAGSTMFLFTATLFAAMFLFPLYEQALRAQSALQAGLLLAPQGLAAMVAMPLGGKLSDSVGPRRLVLTGLAFALFGNLTLTQVGPDTSQALLALSGVPRGIGMGLAFPALLGAAYRTLSPAAIPRATTTVNILQRVGGALGTAVFAVILQHGLDAGRGPDAFATTFWWVLGATAVTALPALALARIPAPTPVVRQPAAA